MNNLNQGASIEAERELCNKCGTYHTHECLGVRTPAAQVVVGELPPPRTVMQIADEFGSAADAYTVAEVKQIVAAAIEADRAQQAGAAVILDDDVEYRLRAQAVSPFGPEGFALLTEAAQHIADLRAQLAAKGQGEISAIVKNVAKQMMDELTEQFGRPDEDGEEEAARNYLTGKFAAISLMERRILALVAPASAQPADLLEIADNERKRIAAEYQQRLADNTCEVGGHVNRQWAHLEGAVKVVQALRRAIGAQPDQRESAAECTQPMLEAAMKTAVSSGLIARYADESAYLRNWDGMKACVNAALAASPAAQPAKDEQK